jgi:hypothetical protein
MRLKSVTLVLVASLCLALQGIAVDTYNTSPIADDIKESFQNEDLFKISTDTGMSPNATENLSKTSGVIVLGGSAFIGGYWSFDLRDITSSTMKLNLSQYQDAVFGAGDITMGSSIIPVTVGGTIQANKLNLYVVPEGSQSLYRLSLTVTPASMNGSYLLTSPGVTQPGIAIGRLIATLQTGAAVAYSQSVVYNQPAQPHTMPLGPKSVI